MAEKQDYMVNYAKKPCSSLFDVLSVLCHRSTKTQKNTKLLQENGCRILVKSLMTNLRIPALIFPKPMPVRFSLPKSGVMGCKTSY